MLSKLKLLWNLQFVSDMYMIMRGIDEIGFD